MVYTDIRQMPADVREARQTWADGVFAEHDQWKKKHNATMADIDAKLTDLERRAAALIAKRV